ncbi:phospho-sugar mutase [Nakamurella aerolata]|uniref:Phospho-sugar mutase n=1 Tax=Nakamurella aerolata TaxID=1656892 RepID=A0A849A8X3_9ACTN|nr:phospho-sugar mutase [Nakamurella aerolata]NNG35993.1 phospho-sugar mutase [Nakamurella aerolata]
MRWIADDPHPGDRVELQRILADAMGGRPEAVGELTDRMDGPLAFGTAGLRGPLRAGPNGLNLAVVRRAAAGLAGYLRATGSGGGLVVVGFDARHRSAEFAADAAKVLAAAGFQVILAPGPVPTPVTAFAVRRLDAVAGVQITASHNPPRDNGVKVYLQAGAQIVPPTDAEIERAIAAVGPAVSIDTDGTPQPWPDAIVEAYLQRAASLQNAANPPAEPANAEPGAELRIALTAMHGVGAAIAAEALRRAGFTDVQQVAAQQQPDADFPTVSFPNPEEPGATDLLLALGEHIGADLLIALDPDADRCAIGARAADGSYRMLRGDETGALLGDAVLADLDRTSHPDPLVATTIVSSSLLKSVAAQRNARYDETLTGFKWIVRAGDGNGTGLVFGYEEALGLCVDPDAVRDKDGITAAVRAAGLAASLKSVGRTVFDALDELAVRHGVHATDQLSVRVAELSEIADAMARLRSAAAGGSLTELAGAEVTEVTDLLPRTDAVVIRTSGPDGSDRVVVRPSGTEPKLKCYLESVRPVAESAALSAAKAAAAERLVRLRTRMTELLGLA